jgi:hypothetical protein
MRTLAAASLLALTACTPRPAQVPAKVREIAESPPPRAEATLNLNGLDKVRRVRGRATRNLFQFGMPPPARQPKSAEPFIPVVPAHTSVEPANPLTFYGYAIMRGPLTRAFLLHDDEVYVLAEGDTVKHRYRVVRIESKLVVIEDTATSAQRTLPLLEP